MFFVAVIVFILSIIITAKICSIMNRNTIGTTRAYITRGLVVFLVTFCILAAIVGSLTGA